MEMHFAGPPGCLVRLQKTTCCGARRTARFWVHAAQPLRPGMQVRRLEQVSIGTDRPTKNRGLVRGILHSRRFNRTLGFAHSCIRSRNLAENWCIRRYQRGLLSSQQPVDLSHVLSGRCMVLHGFAWHTCEETCCHTCKETCCHACEVMWHAMRTQHMHVWQEHVPLQGYGRWLWHLLLSLGGPGGFSGEAQGSGQLQMPQPSHAHAAHAGTCWPQKGRTCEETCCHTCKETCCHTCKETCCHTCEETCCHTCERLVVTLAKRCGTPCARCTRMSGRDAHRRRGRNTHRSKAGKMAVRLLLSLGWLGGFFGRPRGVDSSRHAAVACACSTRTRQAGTRRPQRSLKERQDTLAPKGR